MEFLFLPRSLRSYLVGVLLASLAFIGHYVVTPVGVLLASLAFIGHCVGGHTPNTHLNSMFYNILRNYFWIY